MKKLSDREMQCLMLTCNGMSQRQIGQRLGISHRTVGCHMNSVRRKLGSQTIAEATFKAASFIRKTVWRCDIEPSEVGSFIVLGV